MSEDPSEKEIVGVPWGRRPSLWTWLLLSLPIAFFLLATQSWPAAILLLIHASIGWAFHLQHLATTVSWNWQTILLAFIALAAGIAVTQGFVRWMSALFRKEAPPVKVLLRIVAIFLSGAAAAIAISGVMHETAWLIQKPCVINLGRAYYRTEAINNIKTLLFALNDYEATEHHFPDRLEELFLKEPKLRKCSLYAISSDSDTVQPIIYLKPQQAVVDTPPEPILLIATGFAENRILIGRADCSVSLSWVSVLKKEHPEIHWPEGDDEP